MTTGFKIGIGATLGAGAVGGSAGIAYALRPEAPISIQKQIESSGRTILAESSPNWNIKLDTYKKRNPKLALKLNPENDAKLKKWCTDTLKSDFKDESDSNYLNAKELCTTPTYEEKFLNESKRLANEGEWQGIADTYNNDVTEGSLIKGIEKSKADKNNLKAWCEKTFKEEIPATGDVYTLAEKWCVKPTGQA